MKRNKILIVDDESDIALILKLQLEDAGYLTMRARDGVEGLAMLGHESYSLMLLDIKMPRMDGIEVLEKVHQDYPELAVIMMTAHGNEDIAVEAMKKGAIDYIAKPFSTDDVLKKVERTLKFNKTVQDNLRLQREIADERNKISAILESMADLVVAVDAAGNLLTINKKAVDVLGLVGRRVVGKPVTEILKAGIVLESLPCLVALRTLAPCLDIAYILNTPKGDIPVLSSATPLVDSGGRLMGSVEIIRDISVLRALEQEKEDFVSMLSHDLKSPLTAVVGSIDLVREGRLGEINEEQREYLEAAMESCGEMVEMINTLLDVHKFEAGKMILDLKEGDPRLLVERAVSVVRPVAERVGVKLGNRFEGDIPAILVDPGKFQRLMGNLLSNALKFTDERGEIEVCATVQPRLADICASIPTGLYPPETLQRTGEFLKITVRDTGAGIPNEALGAIFDRFVQAKQRRADKTRRGTGLGLAYCRKVMDTHHGYIWAESVVGRGSTFIVLFPLCTDTV